MPYYRSQSNSTSNDANIKWRGKIFGLPSWSLSILSILGIGHFLSIVDTFYFRDTNNDFSLFTMDEWKQKLDLFILEICRGCRKVIEVTLKQIWHGNRINHMIVLILWKLSLWTDSINKFDDSRLISMIHSTFANKKKPYETHTNQNLTFE